jgi:glycosyltransferase involved in cell wall biosynthesis
MRVTVLHNHPIHYKHLLFTAIAEQGAELNVIFAARSSNLRTASLQPAGKNYRSHFLSDSNFESLPQFRSALNAVREFDRCNPDVVIIGGYSYLACWSVLIWAKLRRKPVALWAETNSFDRPRHHATELIKRIFVRACDSGHVYGTTNREYLESLGMDPSAVLIKKATVDWDTFSRRIAQFHVNFRRFVYVGRFSPEKNLPRLLDAFDIVRGQIGAELVLVGYGPEEQMLRQKTEVLGLEESVIFAGSKTQDEVSVILAEADCLVLPSLSEAWGLVANEAICTGVPIIVSDRCGCAIDLAGGDTGWIFKAEETSDLAEKMLEVCRLPLERLREMGEQAIKKGSEYSPNECAKRIYADLQELINRTHISRGGMNGHA